MIESVQVTKKFESGKEVTYKIYFPKLRVLVESYMDFQKARIAFELRLLAYELSGEKVEDYADFQSMLLGSEKAMEKAIGKELKNYDIYTEYLENIKGIGPILSSYLLTFIGDPSRFEKISALWAYAGYGVTDGEATTVKKHGKKANIRLKTACWKIGEAFVKTDGGYRAIYDRLRAEDTEKHPEKIKDEQGKTRYNPGHLYARAKRKTIKIFLAHLWTTWRQMEGLPVSEPYVHGIMGHSDLIKPFTDE